MVKMMLCKDGSTYEPKQEDLIAWERAYSARGVQVHQEIMSMESWLDANPVKRKTSKGMKRFIDSWLKRAAESGGSPMVKSKKQSSRAISIEDKLADVGWVQNVETKQGAINLFLRKYGFYFDGQVRHEKAQNPVQG
nr:hypothetical protein [uncultured Mediterranean phage uvMED]